MNSELSITEHHDEYGDYLRCVGERVTFLIDAIDLPIVEGHDWFVNRGPSVYGRYVARGGREGGGLILLHREIMQTPLGMTVDHRDKDAFNCRRHNMRNCTQAQNLMNRHNFKRSEPGFRGVYRRGRRYLCIISAGTQNGYKYLGTFGDPVEAARVWDREAFATRGVWAQLNFPNDYTYS